MYWVEPITDNQKYREKVKVIEYKKIIKSIRMKQDLLRYFTEQYNEWDVLETDTEELKRITGLSVKGIRKEDYFYITAKDKIHPMKILVGLLKAKGNLTKAAVDMSIRRDRLENYIMNNEKVRIGAEIVQEMVIDYVEAKLMDKIDEGDRSAVQYWLNTKAIHRGYGTYEQRRKVKNIIADATGRTGQVDDFEIDTQNIEL